MSPPDTSRQSEKPRHSPCRGFAFASRVSSASCQADGATGITTDQRGLPRPDAASPNCDIGAVEVQPPPPTVVTAAFTG